MNIEQLKNQLLESAKDIKLNLSTILTEEGSPDLIKNQIGGVALASAYATKNSSMIESILSEVNFMHEQYKIILINDRRISNNYRLTFSIRKQNKRLFSFLVMHTLICNR